MWGWEDNRAGVVSDRGLERERRAQRRQAQALESEGRGVKSAAHPYQL